MQYIYHGVPDELIGDELVPLKRMGELNPKLKNKYLKKYEGRETILERRIPLLDCLWNDVVQLLPFHPEKVFKLQVQLGLIPQLPAYRFFEIDVSQLDPKKTVVFFKTAPNEESVEAKWLSDVDFKSLGEIPEATNRYYQTLVGTGELPFNYQFVPHILHMGSIDISGSKIISLGE